MKTDLSILLVEDDKDFCEQVCDLLGVYNEIDARASIQEARNALKNKSYDLVILDKRLREENGLELIPEIKESHPDTVVIVLTADKDFRLVNKCLTSGATDYVFKSPNIVPDLLVRIPLAISRHNSERKSSHLEALVKSAFKYEIVGHSKSTNELRAVIQELKGTSLSVLITGETGTGKELIARRLHALECCGEKPRPFVAVNCGALPENLIESELFGHEKGAFTGADRERKGKFEEASGGDLFLDEIGELPLHVQSKLLRVLQEGEVTRLGSNKVIKVNVRVIAATNQLLEELVKEKLFRQDLFYRFNVFTINTTPLRDRPDDIPDLAKFFVLQLAGPKIDISEDALKYLARLQWPGNIRELRNTLERALIQLKRRKGTVIEKQDVVIKSVTNSIGLKLSSSSLPFPKSKYDLSPEKFQEFLENAEREYIKHALELCDDSVPETSTRLGIGKSTIFRKVNPFKITKRAQTEEVDDATKGEESYAN